MPPLGWRKSTDGAKDKKHANQAHTPVHSNPPAVPERTGIALESLGGTSFPQGSAQARSTEQKAHTIDKEETVPMDVDDPSTDSTPAPGPSTVPNGSSSEDASNPGFTPPFRSLKLKLKVKPPTERPASGRGRGRGRGRGARGGRGRGGRARKIVAASPSESSGEESPVEEQVPLESEDDASGAGSEADETANISAVPIDEDLEDEDEDADADADVDPDATAEMDEDMNPEGEMDEQDELEQEDGMNTTSGASKSRLTARQAALVAGGSTMNMLPEATGRKAQRTEAEIALRRSETARKRKHQDAQRLEDEKTETINRLLKKQSAKARNKKALDTPLNELADPTEGLANVTPTNRPSIPCYRWVSSARDNAQVLSFSVPEDTSKVPRDTGALLLAASAQPVVRPTPTCTIAGCTAQRKYRLPGATDFEMGACGMDHLKLLKTQVV